MVRREAYRFRKRELGLVRWRKGVDGRQQTWYVTVTERSPNSVPDTSTGGSVSQASGAASGPGITPSPRS
jgi:hypothetical protein